MIPSKFKYSALFCSLINFFLKLGSVLGQTINNSKQKTIFFFCCKIELITFLLLICIGDLWGQVPVILTNESFESTSLPAS